MKSNPALPNPNCKVLKLIMNQPEKVSKWKAALDILERTSFKTRIDASITFHYNIYHNVYMETKDLMKKTYDRLFKLNVVRLELSPRNTFDYIKTDILKQISESTSLTEYKGPTAISSDFAMKNISNTNRDVFHEILFMNKWHNNELFNKIYQSILEKSAGYSLLKDIQIREY